MVQRFYVLRLRSTAAWHATVLCVDGHGTRQQQHRVEHGFGELIFFCLFPLIIIILLLLLLLLIIIIIIIIIVVVVVHQLSRPGRGRQGELNDQ